jgi:hypothetical protein
MDHENLIDDSKMKCEGYGSDDIDLAFKSLIEYVCEIGTT